jgi:hypothetical protein
MTEHTSHLLADTAGRLLHVAPDTGDDSPAHWTLCGYTTMRLVPLDQVQGLRDFRTCHECWSRDGVEHDTDGEAESMTFRMPMLSEMDQARLSAARSEVAAQSVAESILNGEELHTIRARLEALADDAAAQVVLNWLQQMIVDQSGWGRRVASLSRRVQPVEVKLVARKAAG